MRMMRRGQIPLSEAVTTIVLATMVLFCCLESIMGNFAAFTVHSAGSEKLLATQALQREVRTNLVNELLQAWLQAKIHSWWLRVHFNPPELQTQTSPLSMHLNSAYTILTEESSRASILHILCDLYQAQSQILACYWHVVNAGTTTTSHKTTQYSEPSFLKNSSIFLLYNYVAHLMLERRKALDEWYSQLPLAEKHEDDTSEMHMEDQSEGELRPLLFSTHSAAMNYD